MKYTFESLSEDITNMLAKKSCTLYFVFVLDLYLPNPQTIDIGSVTYSKDFFWRRQQHEFGLYDCESLTIYLREKRLSLDNLKDVSTEL